jgi:TetR/AcrR family transcriptional repressor of bet genes
MPRPSNTTQRRKEIILALSRVMAARGYEGASIVEIARAARLAPGLIHYHFTSKEEILLALVDYLRGVMRARFDRRISGRKVTARLRLEAYIDAHVGLGDDADPAAMACWVNIGAEALRKPEVRAVYEEAVEEEQAILQSVIRDILTDEGRATGHVKAFAAAILSFIQGVYQIGLAASGVIPRGSAAPLIRRMVEGLIAAQGIESRKGRTRKR